MIDTLQDPSESMDVAPERDSGALELGRGAAGGNVMHAIYATPRHTPASSYQTYLFGKAGQEDRPAWSDSMKGRAAIRLVSRGIVGSLFFVAGGRMASQQMANYNEHAFEWSVRAPFHNPLQALAKGIDVTFGSGYKKLYETAARISGTEKLIAKREAEKALWFRDTASYGYSNKGRSFGAEVVGYTFDFMAASVGDAATRNLIQVFDPNVKKAWRLNDKGEQASQGEHAHIDWGQWAKSTASTTWRVFSKNAGEDLFAGLFGYGFQMKFQKAFLNGPFAGKRSSDGMDRFQGHDMVFDRGWNGGAHRRALHPATGKMEIVGDYQLPAAIDLHIRFVGYNYLTEMYREGYDWVGNQAVTWRNNGFSIHMPHLPQHFNPVTAAVDGVANTSRYLAKSFIKANLYMNPAVVPFWFMRASQSKWRGTHFIEPNPNKLGELHLGKPVGGSFDPYDKKHYEFYPSGPDAKLSERLETGFSKTLNYVGKWQYKAGERAADLAVAVSKKNLLPKSEWLNSLMCYGLKGYGNTPAELQRKKINGLRSFTHEYTNAAFSYTPYMFAKAETALRVDDNKGDGKPGLMDKAIYRFMDNVASFNGKGTWKSVKEMWQLGTHFEADVTVQPSGKVTVNEPKAIKTQTYASGAPTTTVAAGDVTHEPANFARREGDKQRDEDKSWVESVVGGNVNAAQIHAASATRH